VTKGVVNDDGNNCYRFDSMKRYLLGISLNHWRIKRYYIIIMFQNDCIVNKK